MYSDFLFILFIFFTPTHLSHLTPKGNFTSTFQPRLLVPSPPSCPLPPSSCFRSSFIPRDILTKGGPWRLFCHEPHPWCPFWRVLQGEGKGNNLHIFLSNANQNMIEIENLNSNCIYVCCLFFTFFTLRPLVVEFTRKTK